MGLCYQTAITQAETILSGLDPAAVSARTGVLWDDGGYKIPWFGKQCALSEGSEAERVVWLHYLISEGTKHPSGELVAYRELRHAGFYGPVFDKRAVRPLVKRFGCSPPDLLKAAACLGGVPVEAGDCAVSLRLLPFVPVTYVLWAGDDELPPEGSILFDRTAAGWLHPEDLAVLASLGAYKLIGVRI